MRHLAAALLVALALTGCAIPTFAPGFAVVPDGIPICN